LEYPAISTTLSDSSQLARNVCVPPHDTKVRGIKVPPKTTATERRKIVEGHFTDPLGPPAVIPDTTPSAQEMRYLLLLLFRIFGTLFSTELKGDEAGNRFDALAVQFLGCIEKIGVASHPDKIQPIWLSKYGILGLLRCRQHFVDYNYPHSLYEGGIEGEGMVKELRPLCPNAVRAGWPLNLINAYNRKNSLEGLTSGFEATSTVGYLSSKQHDANGRRYSSWVDVDFALQNNKPVSIVVLGTPSSWQCHLLVRMFRVTYSRAVLISDATPFVDVDGFVYHSITLDDEKTTYNAEIPVMKFAVLLPIRDKQDNLKYCVLDKDWRFVDPDKQWTILH
jgi:hypothetical protein